MKPITASRASLVVLATLALTASATGATNLNSSRSNIAATDCAHMGSATGGAGSGKAKQCDAHADVLMMRKAGGDPKTNAKPGMAVKGSGVPEHPY